MSLINDALKRTKEAQQQNPPTADGPPLRPADPKPAKAGSGAQMVLFILVAAVIVGNLLLWLAFKDHGAKTVEARTSQTVTAPARAPAPAPAVVAVTPPAAPISASSPAPMLEVASTTANATGGASPDDAGNTNSPDAAAIAVVEPPKPEPLKLQSIIYNPTRPSAMISGKFLFIGDRVRGLRVMAIDQETVTLVGDGQTNVLSLP